MNILTIEKRPSEKFLRRRTAPFDWHQYKTSELRALIQRMRKAMHEAHGIGLSANQVGIDANFFVAEVDNKFYAIFNPAIERASQGETEVEEGCLSVPRTYGAVSRPERITLTGFDLRGKKLKIRAWGLLARVFQHEVDHLAGTLFIDKAKRLTTITPENLRKQNGENS